LNKSNGLYRSVLTIWALLIIGSASTFYHTFIQAQHDTWYIGILVSASILFICYFWLNGIKDLIYTFYFYLKCKKNYRIPVRNLWPKMHGYTQPHIALVYCTYNDFNADSLRASMDQGYSNFKTVILDDSTEKTYIDQVDSFATLYNVKVIRRADHAGFKAGNLNNYLMHAEYDFFVILDSDEIIPNDYITRSLDYFASDKTIGIVQANHVASRNRNNFMSLFAKGVDSHWPTYQMSKHSYGFLSLLGHGAMVSRTCYFSTGGFPHMVAEDLCFSIEARNNNYFVAFAPDIICEEEYPVSYLAFKKRHSKWTQGNMEFIKNYTRRIISAKMNWYEKLDIVLFTYNLPLHAFFSLFVVINVILLPAVHYHIVYPHWMLIPTAIFLVSPMLNDIFFYYKKISAWKLGWYLGHTLLLYGSMFFISLKSSLKSIFGSSTFIVTPKSNSKVTIKHAFIANRNELLFASMLLCISLVMDHSPLPVIMIVIPSLMSVYLSRLANPDRVKNATPAPVTTEEATTIQSRTLLDDFRIPAQQPEIVRVSQ
jgi:cellulose synthase/poly-beta-1,6-N-acetylglucosamine synthase-like glycosyltransferase